MAGVEWTPAEIDRLRQMVDGGMDHAQIAEALGRSRRAVKHKANQYRVRRPREASLATQRAAIASFWADPQLRAAGCASRKAWWTHERRRAWGERVALLFATGVIPHFHSHTERSRELCRQASVRFAAAARDAWLRSLGKQEVDGIFRGARVDWDYVREMQEEGATEEEIMELFKIPRRTLREVPRRVAKK